MYSFVEVWEWQGTWQIQIYYISATDKWLTLSICLQFTCIYGCIINERYTCYQFKYSIDDFHLLTKGWWFISILDSSWIFNFRIQPCNIFIGKERFDFWLENFYLKSCFWKIIKDTFYNFLCLWCLKIFGTLRNSIIKIIVMRIIHWNCTQFEFFNENLAYKRK